MRRREFIALCGAAAVSPTAGLSQPSKAPVIGLLSSSHEREDFRRALLAGLAELGFVEGRGVTIEDRSAGDALDRLPALVAELVQLQVSVIVAVASTPVALAAKNSTQSTPIVFVIGADPVENNIVTSLARPGANITGVTTLAGGLFEKRVALLMEMAPTVKRMGFLVNEANPAYFKGASTGYPGARALGLRLGIEMLSVNASTPSDVNEVFRKLLRRLSGANVLNSATHGRRRRPPAQSGYPSDEASIGRERLHRAIGFGDVVVAPRCASLLLVALHDE